MGTFTKKFYFFPTNLKTNKKTTVNMSRMGHVNTMDEVMEAFAVFDAGKKGFLTKQELQRVLTDLGEMISPQEAQQMLQQVSSGDGKIHYQQVVQSWFAYDN